jgi:phage shock protein A
MNMLKRIRQILAANLNHLLEKAEDPEKMIKQLIREMDESILALRMEVAKAIAAEKRLHRRAEDAARSIEKWQQHGEKAVRDGDDDMARRSVEQRLAAEDALAELKKQQPQAARASQAMKEELRRLEDKIQEARRRKEILVARKRRAQAQKSMLETTDVFRRVSSRADTVLSGPGAGAEPSLESLEDALTDMEAHTEARQELQESARDVDTVLTERCRKETVDKEIEELKRRVNRSG